MQKGKLLFQLATAEDKGQNKSFNSFLGVILVILCIVLYCFISKNLFDSTYDIYNEDENTLFYVLLFTALFSISFLFGFLMLRKRVKRQSYTYMKIVLREQRKQNPLALVLL